MSEQGSPTAGGQRRADLQDDVDRFSLTLGGPLYRLYLRSRLLAPPLRYVTRRIAVVLLITWLPALILAFAAGAALSGVRVPFLLDPEAQARLLLGLPLLLLAEPAAHDFISAVPRQLVERGIVQVQDRLALRSMVGSAVRMRNSILAEVALLGLAVGLAYSTWRWQLLRPGAWSNALDAAGQPRLTPAGWWYASVSLAVFRFLLLRWYYRLLIWYVFLWRVSRLPLHVNALHPDGAGGLGLLAPSLAALTPMFLAQTVVVAGAIGTATLYDAAKLGTYDSQIAAAPLLFTALAALPLAFFYRPLLRARIGAVMQYGGFATRYVEEFREKWLPLASGAHPLGSQDIQSLADLANAYDVMGRTRLFPVGLRALVGLVVVLALPFLPLALTVVPLTELLQTLLKNVF